MDGENYSRQLPDPPFLSPLSRVRARFESSPSFRAIVPPRNYRGKTVAESKTAQAIAMRG